MLEKLAAMNATKTELRQYNSGIIFNVDTLQGSAGSAYFDRTCKLLSMCM